MSQFASKKAPRSAHKIDPPSVPRAIAWKGALQACCSFKLGTEVDSSPSTVDVLSGLHRHFSWRPRRKARPRSECRVVEPLIVQLRAGQRLCQYTGNVLTKPFRNLNEICWAVAQ